MTWVTGAEPGSQTVTWANSDLLKFKLNKKSKWRKYSKLGLFMGKFGNFFEKAPKIF